MKLLAAYLFNEYPGTGTPAQLLDFSPNKFKADTLGNIGFSAANTDGYDALFGRSSAISYFKSSSFNAAGLKSFAIAFKIKFTNNSFYLLNYPGSYDIQINSSGKIIFEIFQPGSFTVTSASAINDGNYHRVICNCTPSAIQIYIDGIFSGSNAITMTSVLSASNPFITGAETISSPVYFIGNLSWLIVYKTSLTNKGINNISISLNKGMDISTSFHSFKTGDLIGNTAQSLQGVVTWVKDSQNFTVLPYTLFNSLNVYKYGNIYKALRQNIMEFDNDFDGNGNGQVRIKTGIDSFSALTGSKELTLDYRGINSPGLSKLLWSRTDEVVNINTLEDILYSNDIASGTFQYDNDVVRGEISGTNTVSGVIRFYISGTLLLAFTVTGDWYLRFTVYRIDNVTLKATVENGSACKITLITGLHLSGGFSSGFSTGFILGTPCGVGLTGQGTGGTITARSAMAEYVHSLN